ncbi:MAG: YiaA/YiaB family inner membrane protein, partial [Pseudomonadota bacterium]
KGFLTMGTLFLTGSTFTLAKTIRDEHEAQLLHNRIDEARTEKLLREVEPAAVGGAAKGPWADAAAG